MPTQPVSRTPLALARTLALSAGAALAAAALTLSTVASAGVQWKSVGAEGDTRMTRAAMTETLALAHADAGQRVGRVVVQFTDAMTDARREALKASGLALHTYLGDNAFFATLAPDANSGAIVADDALDSIRPIRADWKLHPSLLLGQAPTWAVVRDNNAGEDAPSDPVFVGHLYPHSDLGLETAGREIAAAAGAIVTSVIPLTGSVTVEIPMSRLRDAAADDRTMWLEPALFPLSEVNASNRLRTQAELVQAAPYNLNGAGVNVMVYDGGTVRTTHQDFGGRMTNRDASAVSSHATHVSGTIGGSGAASAGQHRGMAPGVLVNNYGASTAQSGWLYTNPLDFPTDYTQAITQFGCVLANNSVGTNVGTNGFDCTWYGNYHNMDIAIDNAVRGNLGAPIVIHWAAGNERQSTNCEGPTHPGGSVNGYHSIGPPSNNKNSIVVGALNSNDDSMTTFSSWGPTDDGRLKPDVSGPGCQSGPDAAGPDDDIRSTTSSSDTAYANNCGTSMSTPTLTGLSALVMQDYRAMHSGSPDPFPSTFKALYCHTAQDILNAGPDYQSGYGSARVKNAIDHMRAGNFLEGTISSTGAIRSMLVVVNPGDPLFKATIAWDDAPGAPLVNPVLVNDLDLRVFDPNNNRVYPWTLDPATPAALAVQTQEDHLNNVEQVSVANPTPGVWRVDVVGFNVPSGPQKFSLMASPLLVNCSSDGVAGLDKQVYRCNSVALLSVVDCDLDLNGAVIDTVQVNVSSTTEPGGVNLVLTETGAATAAFTGSIMLRDQVSGAGIQAVHGDAVTISYLDASSSQGSNILRTDTAQMDCVAPAISNVQATAITATTATITFTTDEPASGTAAYGATCANLPSTANGAGLNISHSIALAGLTQNTTYRFNVGATDIAGNAATDNNGGSCYSFTTLSMPIAELFESGSANDLDNKSVTFTPTGGGTGYNACLDTIAALPTDPTGGTTLTLNTTILFQQVTLAGGAQVKLYGVNYGSFFVGRHGYITFNTGDTNATESFANHFNQPRISGMFDTLNPQTFGSVSWKQLADRAVVSWVDVPEAAAGSRNTFQIEMFFDGRIRTSWTRIDATDGLAGISGGGGQPVGFAETNISGVTACLLPCPGDTNGDRIINFADLNIVLAQFGQAGAGLAGDVNGDGMVTFADLNIVLANFGVVC